MKTINIFFLAFVILYSVLGAREKSQSLFNGKDLIGWTMDVPAHDKKPDLPKPFIVRDGMLVSLGKPFGHLLTEKELRIID